MIGRSHRPNSLETLKATLQRLRQGGIDEELFDVVSGFEALSKKYERGFYDSVQLQVMVTDQPLATPEHGSPPQAPLSSETVQLVLDAHPASGPAHDVGLQLLA